MGKGQILLCELTKVLVKAEMLSPSLAKLFRYALRSHFRLKIKDGSLIILRLKNYFTKSALIILQGRVQLPPAYAKGSDTRRVNKWASTTLSKSCQVYSTLEYVLTLPDCIV